MRGPCRPESARARVAGIALARQPTTTLAQTTGGQSPRDGDDRAQATAAVHAIMNASGAHDRSGRPRMIGSTPSRQGEFHVLPTGGGESVRSVRGFTTAHVAHRVPHGNRDALAPCDQCRRFARGRARGWRAPARRALDPARAERRDVGADGEHRVLARDAVGEVARSDDRHLAHAARGEAARQVRGGGGDGGAVRSRRELAPVVHQHGAAPQLGAPDDVGDAALRVGERERARRAHVDTQPVGRQLVRDGHGRHRTNACKCSDAASRSARAAGDRLVPWRITVPGD